MGSKLLQEYVFVYRCVLAVAYHRVLSEVLQLHDTALAQMEDG